MSRASITLLGTGGSMGVPMVGCSCPVCTSNDPRNHRLRTAAILSWEDGQVVIDVGPDFRQQMVSHKILEISGLILTHAHYDHIGGIDDLRAYSFLHKRPVPCLLSQETLDDLYQRYDYLFRSEATPHLDFQLVPNSPIGELTFLGKRIGYLSYKQGGMRVLGYRFGDLAYLTDLYSPDSSLLTPLEGVRTLIVSALRPTPSPVHLSIDQAVDFAQQVGAEQTYFVHIAHEVDHEVVGRSLPKGISLGYDGMELSFEWQ